MGQGILSESGWLWHSFPQGWLGVTNCQPRRPTRPSSCFCERLLESWVHRNRLASNMFELFRTKQEASEAYSLMLRRQFRTQQKCRLEKDDITALLFQNILELSSTASDWIWQHLTASDCISQDASQEISVQDFEEVEGFSEDRNLRPS